MTTTRVDVEEIESTRSEKLLAVVMTAFLLIGAVWGYVKIDDAVSHVTPPAQMSVQGQQAIERLNAAQARLYRAQDGSRLALGQMQVARESYRTALEAGRTAPGLARAYASADARYRAAQARSREAGRAAAAAAPAAERAIRAFDRRASSSRHRHDLLVALLRLALVAFLLGVGYRLLTVLRRRGTRWLPLAFSVIATAAVLALVLAGDYVTDYVDPLELGPFLLSVVGVAATLVAFAGLQRWLARRVPVRRVRKGECPFCGYPVRTGGAHCEGCGRDVVGACAACGGERRVGAAHCAACGAV